MKHFPIQRIALALLGALAISAAACSDDGDSGTSGGSGDVDFTIWGEEFIEDGIAADEFVDGWSAKFDSFVVVVSDVTVQDSDAGMAGTLSETQAFDLVQPGPQMVGTVTDVGARSWNNVGYGIVPGTSSTTIGGSTSGLEVSDVEGIAIQVKGSATKDGVTKTFDWTFSSGTRFDNCTQVDDAGEDLRQGVVVGNGTQETVQLTIHGDHFFFDSLGEDAELRFQAIADADADDDGTVTLDELEAVPLATIEPADRYMGSNATTLKGFIDSLVGNIGHYQGEGHCKPKAL